ncbi:MAG TPA: hypothetical protein VFB72_15325, partial [Verrucomicrobiae bacterium]|nr:hypothetical protein [Verrucomicrobiae bacterium]
MRHIIFPGILLKILDQMLQSRGWPTMIEGALLVRHDQDKSPIFFEQSAPFFQCANWIGCVLDTVAGQNKVVRIRRNHPQISSFSDVLTTWGMIWVVLKIQSFGKGAFPDRFRTEIAIVQAGYQGINRYEPSPREALAGTADFQTTPPSDQIFAKLKRFGFWRLKIAHRSHYDAAHSSRAERLAQFHPLIRNL